jgi:hypothetical protein
MRLATTAALLGAALALPALAPAAAQPAPMFEVRTAADLARLCAPAGTGAAAATDLGFCYGYGAGALDYHRAITPASARALFCTPQPAPSFDELRGRYVAWVNAAPANAAMRAVDSIFMFLGATYPCPPATTTRR